MKTRILFLLSDTGGGHRAAAQAISEAIRTHNPDRYDIFIEDFWRYHTPWPLNKIPETYPWFTGPGQPLWKLMWFGSARLRAHKIIFSGLAPLLRRRAARYLSAVKPDIVVSVHPFMNHLGLKWLRRSDPHAPFVTVVTDLVSIHPFWVNPHVTRCLVPTEAAREVVLWAGMPPEKVAVCGQPVSLKFAAAPPNKTAARQALRLHPHRQTVLVLGGAEGFGRVYEIARTLAQTVPQAQLVVIAGRNQRLKQALEGAPWEKPAQIHGFVDNMSAFMHAADVLITKAGPGALSEAFAARLPSLIYGYIPGQEAGNVTHVLENGAGAYVESPPEIAALVAAWFQPDNPTLQRMSANAAKLARPTAALEIARHICSLVPAGQPLYVRGGLPPHRRTLVPVLQKNSSINLRVRRRS